eukprot:scaffold3394_cov385-Prasinococcus_capsulatus_cf.AAC.10
MAASRAACTQCCRRERRAAVRRGALRVPAVSMYGSVDQQLRNLVLQPTLASGVPPQGAGLATAPPTKTNGSPKTPDGPPALSFRWLAGGSGDAQAYRCRRGPAGPCPVRSDARPRGAGRRGLRHEERPPWRVVPFEAPRPSGPARVGMEVCPRRSILRSAAPRAARERAWD